MVKWCQWWDETCECVTARIQLLLLWPSTVSEVLVLSTSSKSSVQSRIYHVGHSARLAVVTCSFRGQTRPSATKVSPLRLLSSGAHFHMTSAHHTSVAGSSDRSWRLIFSHKPITLHDSSENNFLLKSVTVTVTVWLCMYARFIVSGWWYQRGWSCVWWSAL